MDQLKLKHPFSLLAAGPSGSGKTMFIKNVIEHRMIHPFPGKIIWCYGAYQPLYDQMSGIEFIDGLPENLNSLTNSLIIIDDLMSELGSDVRLTKLFTKGCHHRNLSVIFIVQNLFHKGIREMSLNANYLVIFKNTRDKSQVIHLGKQLYPGKTKFFQEVYQDATSKAFSYLLIDLKPDTSDALRLRTGLFPGDKYYVYQPR